jgi:hypothetical protein
LGKRLRKKQSSRKAAAFLAMPHHPLQVLILRMPSMPWAHPELMKTIDALAEIAKDK